jgi:uncharacterized damage-inducible protein DinB
MNVDPHPKSWLLTGLSILALVAGHGTSRPSRLVHIFAADRIWLARILGGSQPSHPGSDLKEIAALREVWVSLGAEWKAWAEGILKHALSDLSTQTGQP